MIFVEIFKKINLKLQDKKIETCVEKQTFFHPHPSLGVDNRL